MWMLGEMLLGTAGVLMLGYVIWPLMRGWRRRLTAAVLGLLAAVAMGNAVMVGGLWWRGEIMMGVPVPVSLVMALALGWVGWGAWRGAESPAVNEHRSGRWWRERGLEVTGILGVAAVCAVLFPLLQMVLFGKTDYRRPADVIVVLGAAVYADGRPSPALADRVRTACALYRQGYAGQIVMTGGPGHGAVDEPAAMCKLARAGGVPAEALRTDTGGLNTQASVDNFLEQFTRAGKPRVLVVSHFWHLPRIKMTFARQGLEVYTVPAQERYMLRQTPYLMLRETAALWVYYVRGLYD